MNRVVSILLISCLLLQTFSKLAIVASYEFNKDFISAVLCINKEKPKSFCQGKCYLNKQLTQDAQKEKSLAGNSKVKFEILFLQSFTAFCFVNTLSATMQNAFYGPSFYSSPTIAIFQPPKV